MTGDNDPAVSLESRLRAALGEGDPQRVQALIEAGADIHYTREHDYDALIDAVHCADDSQLLEVLAVLISNGVNLSGVSSYGESGLRVLSRLGRFDGVRLLLEAGADRRHLEWTPLMSAVAFGSIAEIQSALAKPCFLEERDYWGRTAWLIAILTGDVARAELLLEHAADRTARRRCEWPAIFYAIESREPDMLRWLLKQGATGRETDKFGTTALTIAVEADDLECVEILLAAGADVHAEATGSTLDRAQSREMIMRLLVAGADPADANQRFVLELGEVDQDRLRVVSKDEYQQSCTRRFGTQNPERMSCPFWEAMIFSGVAAYAARQYFDPNGDRFSDPVWCAQRFGQSLTLLPDGRAVQIGGEHEDFYDPDFCIYNDVFVHGPDKSLVIYGYPEAVFPPTDFHTATLVGDFIYVIGSLGYQGSRHFGTTPVYRLNIHTFQLEQLHPGGEAPGWISRHRAAHIHPHEIRVWGGTVATLKDQVETYEENADSFVLDLDRLGWQREAASP